MQKEVSELVLLQERYDDVLSNVERMLSDSSRFIISSFSFLYPYGWTINIEQDDVIDFEINLTEEELIDISINPKRLDEKIMNCASDDEIEIFYLKEGDDNHEKRN